MGWEALIRFPSLHQMAGLRLTPPKPAANTLRHRVVQEQTRLPGKLLTQPETGPTMLLI